MKKKIIDFLTEIRPEFDFAASNNFIEEGMLDSFDIVSLVASLDEEYGISIDGTEILPENFSNVDSIYRLLINNGVTE
ncbi:acyl carrier protein [Maribacter polysiphoniae]|uniref:Acyl carrier protein n=1 Tax=Maribacter polysiphoniae TaxID=429344 RepID=A0A316DSL9_9FLAO|nr:acyl carrier protein [Maribacter polysiphoniae]MBD1262695.1 acyl carrier protein [Maribacter polysiphoniae]PWK21101.1 phosphopantetheine binding protein [Maribacter polysiphoniae]